MSRTLAKKLAQVKPGTLFVGVDLGLDRNVAVIINEGGQRLAKFAFPHNQDGYAYLRRRLRKLRWLHQAPAMLVGMEPSNYLWKLLATELEKHQLAYRLVNPFTVKKHREGDQLDRSKDDVRDAFTIADLLRTGKFTETQLLHGDYAELRQVATLYERLRCEMTRHKNRLHSAVGQLFPEVKRVFKDLTGLTAMAMFQNHAAAAIIRDLSEDDFIDSVRRDYEGRRLCVSKLRQAHALAAVSVGLQDGIQALQLMVQQQLQTLALLERQWTEAREAMIDCFLTLPESRYLLSIHGLGLVSAAVILAEIGDPSHYHHGQQWIKLAGSQPAPNLSGRKTRSRTPMSRKGRSRLRTTLFFAVMRLVQVDDAFAGEYLRFRQRQKNPLTKMQALGALMNKLLRILWALVRKRTFYNPAFVHAG
ncbi:MAG: IS110 family transposase [Anaerolineae bacterium]|jgi:transposase